MSSQFKFLNQRRVAVIGVPFNGGQPKEGVDKGPQALLDRGLLKQLEELDWQTNFVGHCEVAKYSAAEDPDHGKIKKPRLVGSTCQLVSEMAASASQRKELVLTLGGDHSIAVGTIAGGLTAYDNAAVIWVDAHADINTPETTDSGNLHGCPVAILLGLAGQIPGFEWYTKPCLTPNRLVYIGLRDVDKGEKSLLKQHNIKAFSMHEVDKYGIGKVVEMAIQHVCPNGDVPIHLTFDIDALDPDVAPATGTPVRGGLTFREGHYICEAVCETGCLIGVDMVEVNPVLAHEEDIIKTVSVGCSLVRCALGETLL